MNPVTENSERERIIQVYRDRDRDRDNRNFFGYQDQAHYFRIHERYLWTLRLLDRAGISDLGNLNMLDVGCGDGVFLRQLLQWGAWPSNLAGIEMRDDQVSISRRKHSAIDVRAGSAERIPWPDAFFDLVSQHTVFTSILDAAVKTRVAQEMARVLKLGGAVIWYDFFYNNPRNPDVRGIPSSEIRSLFPNFSYRLVRISLAPPIARRIPVAMLPVLYPFLSNFRFLRTHYLGILVKR